MTTPSLVTIDEFGDAAEIHLTESEAAVLRAVDGLKLERGAHGRWHVSAGAVVGALRVGGAELHIRPKIAISRLMFLMGYSSRKDAWQDSEVHLAQADDLVAAVAGAYARLVEKALAQGILQGYRAVEDALPVVRGRIRVGEQVRRRPGLVLPVEVAYDEFDTDTAENRILRAGCGALLSVPRVPSSVRRRLQHSLRLLADASPLVRGDVLPRWQPSRLNARYQPALRLAELVFRSCSVDQGPGRVSMSGFLLNLNVIFENFVTIALTEALAPFGGRGRMQDRWHLDEAAAIVMKPDLVWYPSGGSGPGIVVDAKYKAEKATGFPNADLYQMLAYCSVLGLSEGHLVYAKGNEVATRHVLRGSGFTVTQHTLDLAQPPLSLLRQVDALAARLLSSQDESGLPLGAG